MSATETTRFERAAQIEATDVDLVGQMKAEVRSQSDQDKTYTVDLQEKSCTCPDHVFRGTTCKHLARVADLCGTFTLPTND